MTSMHGIVAATDLSASARRAVERAARLSRDLGAPLELVHVANLAPLERLRQLLQDTRGADLRQQVLDTARARLGELAAELAQRGGVAAGIHVGSGAVLAGLAERIDALAPRLAVCGAHGEGAHPHALLGSTVERLLPRVACPLLIVRLPPHADYGRALVAVDFSSASLRAIRAAQLLAPRAQLVLLHVFEIPFEGFLRYASVDAATIDNYRKLARREALEKLRALCAQAGLAPADVALLVEPGDPAHQIVAQAREADCDLAVVGRHGDGLEDLVVGSTSRRVLADAECDVLVAA